MHYFFSARLVSPRRDGRYNSILLHGWMRIGGAKIFSSITNVDPSRNKGMAVGQQFFITENGYIGMRNSQIYDKVFF